MSVESPFIREFNAEQERGSERGIVLVCSSMAEELLKQLLLAYMSEDVDERTLFEGPSAPLGQLSSRAAIAEALGLIAKKQKVLLDNLGTIRNRFAHRLEASLFDSKNADLLRQRYHDIYGPDGVEGCSTPRDHFTVVSVLLLASIEDNIRAVRTEKRQPLRSPFENWRH